MSQPAPFWNIASMTIPVAALTIGALVTAIAPRGDYASALGGLFQALIVAGGFCVLGEAAAIASLVKGERMVGLAIMGVVTNLLVILPAIFLFSRMD